MTFMVQSLLEQLKEACMVWAFVAGFVLLVFIVSLIVTKKKEEKDYGWPGLAQARVKRHRGVDYH